LSRQLQDKVGGVAPAGLFFGERYFICGKEAKAIRRDMFFVSAAELPDPSLVCHHRKIFGDAK
jgi:hypothetical protein